MKIAFFVLVGVALLVVAVVLIVKQKGDKGDHLADLVKDSATSEEFVRAIRRYGVWIMLEESPHDAKNVLFLEPSDDKGSYFALFSSDEQGGSFIASGALNKYAWRTKRDLENDLLMLPMLHMKTSFFVNNDFSKTRFVLNPGSSVEREFTNEELQQLKNDK